MGTRINYEFLGEDGSPSAILYSNSHHAEYDPIALFIEHTPNLSFATTAVKDLLNLRYTTASGAHRVGDPIFTIDLHPRDRELLIQIEYADTGDRKYWFYGNRDLVPPPFSRRFISPEMPDSPATILTDAIKMAEGALSSVLDHGQSSVEPIVAHLRSILQTQDKA